MTTIYFNENAENVKIIEELLKKREKIYIIYRERKYLEHLTANIGNKKEIKNLQGIIAGMISKNKNIEVQLVEMTYEEGTTHELGVEPRKWIRQAYRPIKYISLENFLKL